ncbi:ABC transporter permease [Mycoplasmoides genitalium]|uniref:ABC transporter permease n=1 Tax=Mycoplasmoides genitalium TaxID=2097 RepID=UPI002FCDFCA0
MLSLAQLESWFFIAPALLLAVLSGYLAERVGIINIAINGGMVFGGLFMALLSYGFTNNLNQSAPSWSLFITIPLSVLFSSFIGCLFALAAVKLRADHVIVGTGINLLASGITLFISQNAASLFSDTTLRVRYLFPIQTTVSIEAIGVFVFSLLLIGFVWYLMSFTKTGLRYRAVGENPNVIDTQGISVYKYQWIGAICSMMVAGLSGSLFVLSVSNFPFNSGDVNGLGFIAIAIMIISMWRIIPSIFIGLIFAYAYVFTNSQIGSNSNSYLLRTIPFIISLLVMLLFGFLNVAPKNIGKHFDKGLR